MDFWQADVEYDELAIVQYGNQLFQSLEDENVGNLPNELLTTWWESYLDPITNVYYALWELLEDHAPLASMVKIGNRIKFSEDKRDPMKKEVSDADLPELRIIPIATVPHLQRTSNGSTILKRFRIEVSTGDQRVDAGLFAVEWEIYRALAKWATILMALRWKGRSYVTLGRATAVKDGVAESDLARGIKGWASIWECEVEMGFRTEDMIEV